VQSTGSVFVIRLQHVVVDELRVLGDEASVEVFPEVLDLQAELDDVLPGFLAEVTRETWLYGQGITSPYLVMDTIRLTATHPRSRLYTGVNCLNSLKFIVLTNHRIARWIVMDQGHCAASMGIRRGEESYFLR
jgi:hypothetical protein